MSGTSGPPGSRYAASDVVCAAFSEAHADRSADLPGSAIRRDQCPRADIAGRLYCKPAQFAWSSAASRAWSLRFPRPLVSTYAHGASPLPEPIWNAIGGERQFRAASLAACGKRTGDRAPQRSRLTEPQSLLGLAQGAFCSLLRFLLALRFCFSSHRLCLGRMTGAYSPNNLI